MTIAHEGGHAREIDYLREAGEATPGPAYVNDFLLLPTAWISVTCVIAGIVGELDTEFLLVGNGV